MAKRGREIKHTRGLAVCYYRDIGGGFRELDGSNSPPPTALYAPRVGGRICQAVTFVLVGCAGQQKATSRPCAREEDRGPRRSSTKGQMGRGESGRPLLYAPRGRGTSARRSFVLDCCAGCQADFSNVWRARIRAGVIMPTPGERGPDTLMGARSGLTNKPKRPGRRAYLPGGHLSSVFVQAGRRRPRAPGAYSEWSSTGATMSGHAAE
jgi:hypothetical protein